jgi:ParB-like chromosome segregation protein Spo0J
MSCDELANSIVEKIQSLPIGDAVDALNRVRVILHEGSPFKSEPVDLVIWVRNDSVIANDYNPNSVAPPEMRLLEKSIEADGYTQPIVAWPHDGHHEVVDGFHRHRVGKESQIVQNRVKGYLPLTEIRGSQTSREDRMASTIRHNRARGKHAVTAMSDIVVELKRRNWADEKISRELGMDQDEILRLCQITGLAELFSDSEFSASWDVEGAVTESDFVELTDDITTYGEEVEEFRTVNTSDETRVFHTFDKWECHKAGFYAGFKTGMTKKECEEGYREFLADLDKFREGLEGVMSQWPHSCEHYLTNVAMNRIAWLGQAACCFSTGIPSAFRSGYSLLTEKQQDAANQLAFEYLNKWLKEHGIPEVTYEEAVPDRQAEIY